MVLCKALVPLALMLMLASATATSYPGSRPLSRRQLKQDPVAPITLPTALAQPAPTAAAAAPLEPAPTAAAAGPLQPAPTAAAAVPLQPAPGTVAMPAAAAGTPVPAAGAVMVAPEQPAPKPGVSGAQMAGAALALLGGAANVATQVVGIVRPGPVQPVVMTPGMPGMPGLATPTIPTTPVAGQPAQPTLAQPGQPTMLAPGQEAPKPGVASWVASKVLGGVLKYLSGAKTCIECQRQCVKLGGEPKNAATCAIPAAVITNCVCLMQAAAAAPAVVAGR